MTSYSTTHQGYHQADNVSAENASAVEVRSAAGGHTAARRDRDMAAGATGQYDIHRLARRNLFVE